MYQSLLANRYLTTRLIPLIAVAAVAMCVALVIIVVSVMTGFLNMVRSSGRTLMGDVIISRPIQGVPHYDRLLSRLEADPLVHAATPVVDGLGVMRMPYDQTEGVQFWGIEPESFAEVTHYARTLYWRELSDEHWQMLFTGAVDRALPDVLPTLTDQQRRGLLNAVGAGADAPPLEGLSEGAWRDVFLLASRDPGGLRELLSPGQWQAILAADRRLERREGILEDGLALRRAGRNRPAVVLGIHVSESNQRDHEGNYVQVGRWWMPRFDVTLTTLPIDEAGGLEATPETEVLEVANEFFSGVFVIDDNRVFIPLEVAQRLLHLDEGMIVDPDDPDIELGPDPPRATMVLVRAVPEVSANELLPVVEQAYDAFLRDLAGDPNVLVRPPPRGFGLGIRTWEQQQAAFIGPVEKERELMRTLFSLIYLVCAGLVLAIFWAIVYEKTRDIGILRSIGASRLGISWIFLRYGLAVGVFGAIFGLGLAYLVVSNINHIHDAMGDPPLGLAVSVFIAAGIAGVLTVFRSLGGRLLPLVIGTLVTLTLLGAGGLILWVRNVIGGVVIWDPSVYYFTEIPNEVDRGSAVITMIGAVIFSLVGAFMPAAKAADTDPVRALRYE